MGREVSGRGETITENGGIPRSTGTRISDSHRLYSANGSGSPETIIRSGFIAGSDPLDIEHERNSQPFRIPVTEGNQSQTSKKIPQTDAIFTNIQQKDSESQSTGVKRVSIDCKATVKLGNFSRGGQTRGDYKALDHDLNCLGKHTPFGIVDEDTAHSHIIFGSSFKTSDFIVDSLRDWWRTLPEHEKNHMTALQIKVDNGPESSGNRTQFLKRIVEFTDHIGKPLQWLYYPPYHSKYNPIERCWGILELHWNGAQLTDTPTLIRWAESMTWKGLKPTVLLNQNSYEKGISLDKKTMKSIEARLIRNPSLKNWDILVMPACW